MKTTGLLLASWLLFTDGSAGGSGFHRNQTSAFQENAALSETESSDGRPRAGKADDGMLQHSRKNDEEPGMLQLTDGTLRRLQRDENLTIYFSSFGCFSHYGKKLVFTHTADGIELKVFDGQATYLQQGQAPSMEQGKLLNGKVLTDADLQKFAEFEKELSRRRDGGCTTSETYTMVSNYGTLSVTDASCRWFGMNQLMTDLFGKII